MPGAGRVRKGPPNFLYRQGFGVTLITASGAGGECPGCVPSLGVGTVPHGSYQTEQCDWDGERRAACAWA
jgi:hypothetical protein